MSIRIGVVDNDILACQALSAIIVRLDGDFTLSWYTTSASVATRRCIPERTRPDVLVIDMSMDEMTGAELCMRIRRQYNSIGIVCVTSFPLAHFRTDAIQSGAQALVAKHDIATLAQSIHRAAKGLPVNDDEGFSDIISAHNRLQTDFPQSNNHKRLSNNELRILKLYSQGLTTPQILDIMGITKSTAASYERRAMQKLGAHTRIQAIVTCIRSHIL